MTCGNGLLKSAQYQLVVGLFGVRCGKRHRPVSALAYDPARAARLAFVDDTAVAVGDKIFVVFFVIYPADDVIV